jgi:anti-anti-sigma regulatory factor
MPLVGTIDQGRAQQILETLLEGIAHHQAEIVILDITGVPEVDNNTADILIRSAQAVKLLGARVMLTGIQPRIAQTLTSLEVNLGDITTHSTLQSGVAQALQRSSS